MPLSNIELTIKACCLGKSPIIVCIPDDDIIMILSPIFKFKSKLNSFPIDILLFSKLFEFPIKLSAFATAILGKSFLE